MKIYVDSIIHKILIFGLFKGLNLANGKLLNGRGLILQNMARMVTVEMVTGKTFRTTIEFAKKLRQNRIKKIYAD